MKTTIISILACLLLTTAHAQTDSTLYKALYSSIADSGRIHVGSITYGTLTSITTTYRPDTVRPYNVVGVFKDGSLQMFNCKYLVRKNRWEDWHIIGVLERAVVGLIGLYSYEDEDGIHNTPISTCPTRHKGDRLINWAEKGTTCCK